jgi:tRNA U34 5-methylaminomethyl-2-thiouridine-forming methyltransferase MnmC
MENNPDIKLILTEDGSHSLYIPSLRETYHSTKGALQESRHVFIHSGLDFLPDSEGELHVLEVGFGTGLNVLLVAEWALKNQRYVFMKTLEAYPLPDKLWRSINYPEKLDFPEAFIWWNSIHESEWNISVKINPFLTLNKQHIRLEDYVAEPSTYDCVFFDAFAPNKQSEMWAMKILEKIVICMKEGGNMVTYCAQGQFKRSLNSLELEVQTLDGPPGKKEMVRGIKPFNNLFQI